MSSKTYTIKKWTSSEKYRDGWARCFGFRGEAVEYCYIDECSGIDIDEVTSDVIHVQKTPARPKKTPEKTENKSPK